VGSVGPGSEPGRPVKEAEAESRAKPATGVSAFLGKVLEQLNLSAWLPAAMLVGNAAILFELHAARNLDAAAAIRALTAKPLGILVVLLFALVLTTIVTQAFEFEAIRLMEGYLDRDNRVIHYLVRKRINHHAGKLGELIAQQRAAEVAAWHSARPAYDGGPIPADVLDAAECAVTGEYPPRRFSRKTQKLADALDWEPKAAADALYLIQSLTARVEAYPEAQYIMPTRLGNVLRAAERSLSLKPGEQIEGFVLRCFDRLPPTLAAEHQDYRTRLDMYCTLVLVYTVLAVAAPLALRFNPWCAAVAACYLFMARISYEAAIASARGYGEVLREIDGFLRREAATGHDALPSSFGRVRAWLQRAAVHGARRRLRPPDG
jgi:hypothetical protein